MSRLAVILNRTEDKDLKLQIYRKPTHTDQYLNFNSHHPIEHKLSVVRTLLDRSQSLVTNNDDKEREDIHVQKALRACGYPEWSFSKVRHQMESTRDKKEGRLQRDSPKRPPVVIPYVQNVSDSVARIMRKYDVPVAMKPYQTLKNVLVHPKDKQNKEEITECV